MENSLYLVLTKEYCNSPVLDIAKEAIEAGIDVLQMREKGKAKEKLLSFGRSLRKLCQDIPFIVNDDPYLALELQADGVHLGQKDFANFPKVGKIVGDKIIGLSTHSIEQVKQANKLDIDYIAYGPIFETKTKDYSIGIEDIPKVLATSNKPVVFIGGINKDNIDEIVQQGASNIAVIRAITQSSDISSTVKALKSLLTKEILIILNGKTQLVKSQTLPDLLAEKNYNPASIIVEYNEAVVKPEEWGSIKLRNNDNVEIVGIFAGG